jgi:SAM-dependent methyltransferase
MEDKNAAGLEKYYADRAGEYDRVYLKPERQPDLRKLELLLGQEFDGLDVLEIACGTGYWTQFIARSAGKILAIDYNPETIRIARNRYYGKCAMEFEKADAYVLGGVRNGFTGGFCGFWWSHISKDRKLKFLEKFHSHLATGARVIMIDNRYVEGSSTPISRRDAQGNTFQMRKLEDGTVHEILKNFPSKLEIENDLSGLAREIQITFFDYYWLVSYRTNSSGFEQKQYTQDSG